MTTDPKTNYLERIDCQLELWNNELNKYYAWKAQVEKNYDNSDGISCQWFSYWRGE